MKCTRNISSKFLQSHWLSWRLLLLVLISAVVLSGAASCNEQPNWNAELNNLRLILLNQIEYAQKLSELSERQKANLEDYEKLLEKQKNISQDLETRIVGLETQLLSSQIYTESLQAKLLVLRSLHSELEIAHEKLSKSWDDYKQEAERQIKALERKLARDRAWRWIERAGFVAVIVAIIVLK